MAGVDRQNNRLHRRTLAQNFAGMLDPPGPRQIGYMYQAIDAFLDLDEGAELRHVSDTALDHRANAVPLFHCGPWIGFQLFQAKRDPPVFRVDLKNHALHLIARMHQLRGMLHAAGPRHFTDVNQPFDARVDFHESAVIRYADNPPHDARTGWESVENPLPRVGQQLLDAERNTLPPGIELQNLDCNLIANVQYLRGMGDPPVG